MSPLPRIMDRNLGAPDVNYHGNSTGSVYYQFGRKDPFEGGTLYKPDGTTVSISNIAWDATTQESSKKGKNVPYSVQNPLKFITGSSTWTTGDQYCPADGGTFLWQDPKAVSSSDGKVKKSIFDPCPSGWMVPVNGTWAGFGNNNPIRYSDKQNGPGRYYYPAGTGTTNIYAFYPCAGYRQGSNGSITYANNDICYWSCTPSALSVFYMDDWGGMNPSNNSSRAQGNSVRCIQEYF